MTAKEMFEKLGWNLVYARHDDFFYSKKIGDALYDLIFYLEDKTYEVYCTAKEHDITYPLNANEHLAITQQMKELGWIE
jgi:hypothetical protein